MEENMRVFIVYNIRIYNELSGIFLCALDIAIDYVRYLHKDWDRKNLKLQSKMRWHLKHTINTDKYFNASAIKMTNTDVYGGPFFCYYC